MNFLFFSFAHPSPNFSVCSFAINVNVKPTLQAQVRVIRYRCTTLKLLYAAGIYMRCDIRRKLRSILSIVFCSHKEKKTTLLSAVLNSRERRRTGAVSVLVRVRWSSSCWEIKLRRELTGRLSFSIRPVRFVAASDCWVSDEAGAVACRSISLHCASDVTVVVESSPTPRSSFGSYQPLSARKLFSYQTRVVVARSDGLRPHTGLSLLLSNWWRWLAARRAAISVEISDRATVTMSTLIDRKQCYMKTITIALT